MKALVIGGTRFVGAAIVDALLARGDDVTLFSRGRTNAELFANSVRHVAGDRASDISRVTSERFDVVFDTCGYRPDVVEAAASGFADRIGHYVFISTASVYQLESAGQGVVTEDQALTEIDRTRTLKAPENYGPLKVLCEQAVEKHQGGRATILRPSLIVGPRDYTDRFPYWPRRLAAGGDVLVPGDGDDPAQIVDARDLGAFARQAAVSGAVGVFNVAGPKEARTFRNLIDACQTETACTLHWAGAEFLRANDVAPWKDMPCWLGRDHESAAMLRLDITAALEAVLLHRPWAETAADTRAWHGQSGRNPPWDAGLTAEREAELLALLNA